MAVTTTSFSLLTSKVFDGESLTLLLEFKDTDGDSSFSITSSALSNGSCISKRLFSQTLLLLQRRKLIVIVFTLIWLPFPMLYSSSAFNVFFISSNSVSTFVEGLVVNLLTMIMAASDKMKPGIISYMNPLRASLLIQIITVTAPTMIPESAPQTFIRFQYKLNRMAGPNAEPNPAHAYPTKSRMVSFGVKDNEMATIETSRTVKRPIQTSCLSVASRLKMF